MSTPSFPPNTSLNLTTLTNYNYTLHPNLTLSNSTSTCIALFAPYLLPSISIFANGTFVNATSCLNLPIRPLQVRGGVGVALGVGFVAVLVWTLARAKGGLGRGWGMVWALATAACGAVSCFSGVDVDRDYVPGTAVVLQAVFYTALLPLMLGIVWEVLRHRGGTHSYHRSHLPAPFVFYLLLTLHTLTTLPRPWSPLQLQRSPVQTAAIAQPAATDLRFKLGACFAVLCLVPILVAAFGRSRRRTGKDRLLVWALLFLVGIRVSYTATSAWLWAISPYNIAAPPAWIHGAGYAPALCILAAVNAFNPETPIGAAQRGQRDEVELIPRNLPPAIGSGAVRRQWSASFRSGETVRRDQDEGGEWWWQRQRRGKEEDRTGSVGASTRSAQYTSTPGTSMLDVQADTNSERTVATSARSRDSSTGRRPPQVVRSMLDV